MTRPTIVDVWRTIAKQPGIDPPEKTPRWLATVKYLNGLELTDGDVTELVAATHRSADAIKAHAQRVVGRRRFRQFWARIGRRGRKSATAALIAIYETMFGGHEQYLLPGERGFVVVMSIDIAGSNVIGRFVRLFADALGAKHSTTRIGAVSAIELSGYQIGIAMPASTEDSPRGVPICVLILDEIAHKPTGDNYADTDTAIMAAAEPAMAQFADPLVVGISTGMGRDGVHYERVERALGNDAEEQILAVTGASWEWSKDITREKAVQIADGDADVMLREFEGGVSENEALWMPQEDARAMFEPRPDEYYVWGDPFRIIDAAESSDTFAYLDGVWGDPDPRPHYRMLKTPDGADAGCPMLDDYGYPIALPTARKPLLWIFNVGGFDGPTVRELGMDHVIRELAREAKAHGVKQIIGDDRGGPYLEALFSRYRSDGIRFGFVHYANLKHEAVGIVRAWARDRQIYVQPPHEEMRKQCLRYRRYIRGASFQYGKQGVKDDYCTLLITLAVSLIRQNQGTEQEPRVHATPMNKFRGGRHELSPGDFRPDTIEVWR